MENKITQLNDVLNKLNIKAECVDFNQIQNYSYYDLEIEVGSKLNKISSSLKEIGLAIKSRSRPSVKILSDKGIVRIEIVDPIEKPIKFFSLAYKTSVPKQGIQCLLGQYMNGNPFVMDISKCPHLLIAGTTGSGKSSLLNVILSNIIFRYRDAQVIIIDPKDTDFSKYKEMGCAVKNTFDTASFQLKSLLAIMNARYDSIRAGVSLDRIPYLVCVIDEFADLIMQDSGDEFHTNLCMLAQKCRAAKMHLVIATQRPTTTIINGNIKANFPARIACKTASSLESRIILDENGAEHLNGKGDCIVKDNYVNERMQSAFTSQEEVLCQFNRSFR